MTYFGYPLDIHGWKTRPETEPDKFRSSEPENRGRKIQTKPKPARHETCGIWPETASLPSLMGPSGGVLSRGGCEVGP
jgi:hypothetical protein